MINKILSNANNLIQYIILFMILLLIIYLIYKIFIIENESYMLNERLTKIELQLNTQNVNITDTNDNNEELKFANMIMNEVFCNSSKCNINHSQTVPVPQPEEASIDIDEIINDDVPLVKEEIFDLKKEVLTTTDDNQSIVSSSNNKKKLQKLNLDKLKDKCQELGLSQEGNKSQLIDRILEEQNKGV